MPPVRPDPRHPQNPTPNPGVQPVGTQNPTPNPGVQPVVNQNPEPSDEQKRQESAQREEAARQEESARQEATKKAQEEAKRNDEVNKKNEAKNVGVVDPNLHPHELTRMGELKSDPPNPRMKKEFKSKEEEEQYKERFAAFVPNTEDPNYEDVGPTLVVINWERRGTDLFIIPSELIDFRRFQQFNNKTVNDATLNETDRRDFQRLLEKFHEVYSDFNVTSPPKDADPNQEFTFKNVMTFNRHF